MDQEYSLVSNSNKMHDRIKRISSTALLFVCVTHIDINEQQFIPKSAPVSQPHWTMYSAFNLTLRLCMHPWLMCWEEDPHKSVLKRCEETWTVQAHNVLDKWVRLSKFLDWRKAAVNFQKAPTVLSPKAGLFQTPRSWKIRTVSSYS